MHNGSTIENLVGRRIDDRRKNSVAVFIDGYNIDRTSADLGIELNYQKLYDLIDSHSRILTMQYFLTTMSTDPQHRLNRRLYWMRSNRSYTVVSRPLRTDEDGNTHPDAKTDMDTYLVVAATKFRRESNHPIDRVILMSGDGDFVPLVQDLRDSGIAVTVVSSIQGERPNASRALRNAASDFVDILDPWFYEATTGVTEPVT